MALKPIGMTHPGDDRGAGGNTSRSETDDAADDPLETAGENFLVAHIVLPTHDGYVGCNARKIVADAHNM